MPPLPTSPASRTSTPPSPISAPPNSKIATSISTLLPRRRGGADSKQTLGKHAQVRRASASVGLVGVGLGRCQPRQAHCVKPLSGLTIRLETLTGWKSASTSWLRQARSASFQRESGVPIRPPVIPLSARMIP